MPNYGSRLTIAPITSLVPLNHTSATSGAAVDLAGVEAALVHIAVGAVAGAGTVKIQESATTTDGDFTDVADADLIGITGNTSGNAVVAATDMKIDYIGTKRYIRVRLSAVTTGAAVHGSVIKSHLRHTAGQPV